MKYTVQIKDSAEFDVDFLEFGIAGDGASEGWADLYIRVVDEEEEIYTDADKKSVWMEWLDACCGEKNNPEERIRKVVAKVYGGDTDSDVYRTLTIENGYIDSYVESSAGTTYQYQAVIKRAPLKKGKVSVE